MRKVYSMALCLTVFIFTMVYMGSAQIWNGTWMNGKNSLTITNETKKGFHFLFITNNVKDLEGDAKFQGDIGIFKKNKSDMKFQLAIDTSLVQVSFIDNNGRPVTFQYKMSYEDFFKKLNKDIETPTAEQAPVQQSSDSPKDKAEFMPFFSAFQNALNPRPDKNILSNMIKYPLELKHDGTLIKYDKKKFVKNINDIFKPTITGRFFINDYVKFNSFAADASWNGLGVTTNSIIFTATVEPENEVWSYFTIYVSKIKGEFKIITIETD